MFLLLFNKKIVLTIYLGNVTSVVTVQMNEGTNHSMSDEETITLDGVDYKVETLSDEGKAIVTSLRFVNKELNDAQSRVAVLNTAKSAYIASLKNELSTKN